MKSALLILDNGAPPEVASPPDVQQRQQRCRQLRELFAEMQMPVAQTVADENEWLDPPAALRTACSGNTPDRDTTLFIAGNLSGHQLVHASRQLRSAGFAVVIVDDAITGDIDEAIDGLVEGSDSIQLAYAGGVRSMLKRRWPFVYAFAKVDVTATVVAFFDGGRQVLCIKRKEEPYRGEIALPGGFLRPARETLRQAARRELLEETCIDLDEHHFLPVDERSSPNRDPRGHVIDYGFYVIIPDGMKGKILSMLSAADDAEEVGLRSVEELLQSGMAFDHGQLLRAALVKAGYPTAV